MQTIPVGTKLASSKLVTPDLAIDFLGPTGPRVLATPNLIWGLELAARNSILPMLGPDEDSVGIHIDARHLAATPIGMQVTFCSTVVAVDGRKVSFACEAFDEVEKVAEGTHQRVIISVSKFADSVLQKISRAKGSCSD